MKKNLLLIAPVLMLAACGDKNEASESNFKKSISKIAEQQNVCLPLILELQNPDGSPIRKVAVGETQIQIADKDKSDNKINKEALSKMEALVDADMYQQNGKETTKTEDATIRTTSYLLTEKGAQQVQATTDGPVFCIGREKVEKINWFTEPTPSNGVTVSKVSYQAEFVPEKWAKKLLKTEGWQYLEEPREKFTTLIQTNTGWRDIRELR
ncbi:MAG: hypothetical protein Q4C79_10820 [Neisseria sp.]|uniref:hypothetical protein n=1 Tax=Neisseria sp. TaxID=192066 RepID=UPI0026DC1D80|nr:hypothetical protein [Neisseria sp.]MDO4249424.1 hypothetical protein [Neisseria sp.]